MMLKVKQKGYGFIGCKELFDVSGRDVFLHIQQIHQMIRFHAEEGRILLHAGSSPHPSSSPLASKHSSIGKLEFVREVLFIISGFRLMISKMLIISLAWPGDCIYIRIIG
jgi:cold shock CspA family protein